MEKYTIILLKKQNLFFLVFVIFFACYLLFTIENQSFWHDEIYTLSFMRGIDIYLFKGSDLNTVETHSAFWYKDLLKHDTFWTHLHRNLIHEGHPPLYYLLLKFWTYISGISEFGLRSFSIFISCISLFLSFKIGNIFSQKYKVLLPILLGTSPLFIYYSTEARSYSMYILFAMLCFFYAIKIIINLKSKTGFSHKNLYLLIISAILLFYTHYYGVFFYWVLAMVLSLLFLKYKKYKLIILLPVPVLTYIPWIKFIQQQTIAHKIHWTNGYLGFTESLNEFSLNLISLGLPPLNAQTLIEFWLLLLLTIILVANFVIKNANAWQAVIGIIFLMSLYGLTIIGFDKLLNHHTIAVSRYYFPLQFIVLFCFFFMILHGHSKRIGAVVSGLLITFFLYLQGDFYKGIREPKQMYREAAAFISQNYNPEDVDLVISPSGPSTIGIAYYLSKDFNLHSLPPNVMCEEYKKRNTVVIEQRLGLGSEPWTLSCKTPDLNKRTTRFVSLDIINAQ